MSNKLLRSLAGACASLFLLRKGKTLWEANSKNWSYRLSKMEKLWCGLYIILHDYAAGLFPPQYNDANSE